MNTRGIRPAIAMAIAMAMALLLSACVVSRPAGTPSPRLAAPRSAAAASASSPTMPTTPTSSPTPPARLTVAPEVHADTYRRALYGRPWEDTDRNGCDQRDDVLARDLSNVTRDPACHVLSGTFVDPYTGAVVDFRRGPGTSSRAQVDHIVSLAEAWRSGAWQWSPARRLAYATDERVLVATSGTVNQAKGDDDPTAWHPSTPDRACWYARRVVAIKQIYGLTVDEAEMGALIMDLAGCRPAVRITSG